MSLYVDDKKVGGIKELCEALKISEKDIPYKKRIKEFVQRMERDIHGKPKRDQNGNYTTRRKICGSPVFSAYIPALGYEVKIRFATTQRRLKDNDFSYSPTVLDMLPAEDGVAAFNDNLEFVFWYLHPWNLQSPFHQAGSPWYYEYNDEEAQSKTENDYDENMIDALGYIVGQYAKPMRELRAMCKGLNFGGVDDMSDEVVKKTLKDYAKKDPLQFINQVDSRETVFSGLIQDAVDKGILKTESINGMSRWYLNGKEILPIPYSMDPMLALKEEMSTKWHLYSAEIQNSLLGLTVTSNLAKPEMDEYFEKQVVEHEYPADVSPELKAVLKQMKEDQVYEDKIKKLAQIDPNDQTVHHQIRKSYEANKEAVELYKSSLNQVELA